MLILLFKFCMAETFVEKRQVFVYSDVKRNGESVTKSVHHAADVTKKDESIKAYEAYRNLIQEETPNKVRAWHSLVQKAGAKEEQVDATRMRQAMGFGEQFPGQAEKGRLNVVDAYNVSGPIANIEFNPSNPSQRYASQIFCDDGRCQSSDFITGIFD